MPDWMVRGDSVKQGLVAARRTRIDFERALEIASGDSLLAARFTRPPQLECLDTKAARASNRNDYPPVDSLSHVSVPTLFVWGSADRMLSGGARDIVQYLPQAQVRIMEGIGHDPWFEVPDLFFEVVDDFLIRTQ